MAHTFQILCPNTLEALYINDIDRAICSLLGKEESKTIYVNGWFDNIMWSYVANGTFANIQNQYNRLLLSNIHIDKEPIKDQKYILENLLIIQFLSQFKIKVGREF